MLPVQHPTLVTEGGILKATPVAVMGCGMNSLREAGGEGVSTLRCRQLGPPRVGVEGRGGNLEVESVMQLWGVWGAVEGAHQ